MTDDTTESIIDRRVAQVAARRARVAGVSSLRSRNDDPPIDTGRFIIFLTHDIETGRDVRRRWLARIVFLPPPLPPPE